MKSITNSGKTLKYNQGYIEKIWRAEKSMGPESWCKYRKTKHNMVLTKILKTISRLARGNFYISSIKLVLILCMHNVN